MFLWSGGRCVGDILCWDIRYAQQPLHRLSREQYNNQRIDFDLDRSGRFVVAGDQNGRVVAYDVLEAPILPSEDATPEYWKTQVGPGKDPVIFRPGFLIFLLGDCCNGISLHPTAQFAVTSSGMRHFALDDESLPEPPVDYCLRLWKIELDVERTAQSTSAPLNNDLQ
uniref:Uncharacterized protein n=1 Tax=Spongospora subterranea TaxID=70186 RepID=A0A0H5QKE6_9EUKA|eukprot:CRZ02610.1 hypothetical protein [Spongospora subterranea]